MTTYLLAVNGSKIDTKTFASLYVGVCKADKTTLKGGQPSTHFLCILKESFQPYFPMVLDMSFPLPSCFFRHGFRVNNLFINLIDALFFTDYKILKMIIFTAVFWNLLWSHKKFSITLTYLSPSDITIELPFANFSITICLLSDRFFRVSNSPFDRYWGKLLL